MHQIAGTGAVQRVLGLMKPKQGGNFQKTTFKRLYGISEKKFIEL